MQRKKFWSRAPRSKDPTELMGRTECNRVVTFKGQPRLMNELIELQITEAYPHSLRGAVPLLEEVPA